MMRQHPVIFVFNSPLASGCDYVVQTMRIVAKTHPVYGVALGDIISFPKWLVSRDKWIVRHVYRATIIRPVSIIPGIRFRFVRMCAFVGAALAVRVYVNAVYGFGNKFLWFFEPFHLSPLLRCFAGYSTVYDCVDYYPGFNLQAKQEHEVLMRRSRFIFANSTVLARELKKLRPDVVTVPLGFAPELFRHIRVKPIRPNKRPFVVGYVGSISDRMDFQLLTEVVEKLPDILFLFVGALERSVFGMKDNTEISMRTLCRKRNVRWITGVSKRNIPEILSRIDVGIIPYRTDTAFNRYSYPMKVMEYFAAGRPIVSTEIYSLFLLWQEKLLSIVANSMEMTLAIEDLSRNGWLMQSQLVQRATAGENAWEVKIGIIFRHIFG